MRPWVVVPARDEQARIGACLDHLAATAHARRDGLDVVVVLDACTDATAAIAAVPRHGLRVHRVDGPGRGSGPARRRGLDRARALAGDGAALLLSTDADSRVPGDWVCVQLAAARAGAQAIGGRILLDPSEAAALPPQALRARAAAAPQRLASVRRHAPGAEHHHFSGASLSLTTAAYDAVQPLADVDTLEDEVLAAALTRAGIAIHYLDAVHVVTSARTDGRAARGLAHALRAWS